MTDPLHVLYVEDDPDIRVVAELALEDEGFVLHECESGAEALEKATTFTPDLLLLDVMMPGMDGPTTLSKLRDIDGYQNVPVIFMTAKVQTQEVEAYKSLGAKGIISKPFDPMELASQIKGILQSN